VEKAYTPSHIANFFLDKAEEEGARLTQMKLQKLVYIGYGWALALLNRRVFEEQIEAWQHGPVIPSLYHEFKHFGSSPITNKAVEYNFDSEQIFCHPKVDASDEGLNFVLEKAWDTYKHFNAWALRNKTHEPNTPWAMIYDPKVSGKVIPPDLIREYYRNEIESLLNV